MAGCDSRPTGPRVFIARGQRYDRPLEPVIRDGLIATGLDPSWFAGRRVLLKPNLVEPGRDRPQATTHPAMIVAAAEVFRQWGASVSVGEGAGHVRDTEAILHDSAVIGPLAGARLPFHDLNYAETRQVENRGRASRLASFQLPDCVIEADLVVSLPKLKTHHWIGMTASMKNLFGTLPGCIYGWPKNVLHHLGIPETVFDLVVSLPRSIAIVDAIDCMEGDGPILGDLKAMGLVVIGDDLAAVDSTCARIMGFEPGRLTYLDLARSRGLEIRADRIQQRGESIESVRSRFRIIDAPHLTHLRNPTIASIH